MHNAPPVAYPVGRFVWGRMAWLAGALLSACGLIGWQALVHADVKRVLAAGLFWAACVCAAAVWAPKHALTGGRLLWSGDAWFWQQDGDGEDALLALSVSVGLDTGSGLLLWVILQGKQGAGRGPLMSAWLQSDAMPSKWHGFRCAVYSRPKMNPQDDVTMNGRF